jgi:hypothetical protein
MTGAGRLAEAANLLAAGALQAPLWATRKCHKGLAIPGEPSDECVGCLPKGRQ